jgi:spore germination protein PE
MFQRTACVDRIKVDSVSFSSIFQIGDSQQIQALSRAIAVQREAEIFFGNEGSFAAYSIFSEQIPYLPVDENIASSTQNLNPMLKVRNIEIMGVSSSSVVHLGNSSHISMEARVKHIRQLLPRK